MTAETSNARGDLPSRDESRAAPEQGLFRKFDVRRTDGSDAPGGKHHGCEYFVLDMTHDPHAKAAAASYADSAQATHPQLATDMRDRYGLASPPPADARGDVRGLVAKWRTLADEALRRSGTWNGNDVADRIEFMADELESALAAEGVQAGEVVELRRQLYLLGGERDRYKNLADRASEVQDRMQRAIDEARSQQPEARGGVDEAMVERMWEAWQPIETAPRDGTKILGFDPHWRDPICVISWSEWGEWRDWSGVHPFRSATHWRPLPDPPQDSPTPPDSGHERG